MPLPDATIMSEHIRSEAKKAGFSACGIARAKALDADAQRLDEWLTNEQHAGMSYMARNSDKRTDPTLLAEGTKTVISLAYSYHTTQEPQGAPFRLAKYAYLYDYHHILKEKMRRMIENLQLIYGDFHSSVFTDSAPILERAWAVQSGLGWIGKNACLIIPKKGSEFFLCEILTDLEPTPDSPFTKDFCGTCTRCIEACPTKAINNNRTIDASRCISYLTIEHKGSLEPMQAKKLNDYIFGCDICQDVCPWNKFSTPNPDADMFINQNLLNMTAKDWQELSPSAFRKMFKHSALYRAGYRRVMGFVRGWG